MDKLKIVPNPDQVRQIFNDTYNVFYKKWKDISTAEQWVDVILDMRDINKKHNCDLCHQILLELVKCIESEFKQREVN